MVSLAELCPWLVRGLEAPFHWEIHFKITPLLCSASIFSTKRSNNLVPHMCASYHILINRQSVSVNLIKAGLPLRGDRDIFNGLSKIRFLNLQAWDQTLGLSEFIKVNVALREFSEQPAMTFETSLCTVILTCILLFFYLTGGKSTHSFVPSSFLCAGTTKGSNV